MSAWLIGCEYSGTVRDAKSAVAALEARARTPEAFNWTPAMQAIWPAEMRPTMSGLLAIWEAMSEAAEYGEGRLCWNGKPLSASPGPDDGWIEHIAGGPCPVPRGTKIDVRDADGYVWEDVAALENSAAEEIYWTGLGITKMDSLITAWRPAK